MTSKNSKKSNQKFCFRKDEDSHLYLLPLELAKSFEKECAKAYKNDDFDDFNDKFEQYRTGSSIQNYSFENPEET